MADLVVNHYVRSMDEQYSLYEWFARQYGLTHKSMQILFWVLNYPEVTGSLVTQKLLAEKTYSSKQVVHATIKTWQKKGYVSLLENPEDKRHKLIQLTDEGEAFASRIYQQLTAMEERASQVLLLDEQAILTQLTQRYNQALTREMEKMNDTI